MWGIIPAAGKGSRIQPLAFSKELLPVSAHLEDGRHRPRAVSDYLIERLVIGGATRLCCVISPSKSDILEYYGGSGYGVPLCYCVQAEPLGLCDAIFRALPVIDEREPVLIGLPDTVWFPADGFRQLPDDRLSFLLFHVERPQFFDAVIAGDDGRVTEIQVKQPAPGSNWIWGAFKMPGAIFRELHDLWLQRGDEYMGTLVNEWIARGGQAWSVRASGSYLDVGAMEGYFEAMRTLAQPGLEATASGGRP
jgi:glucose-1-phosphate thymidylyltransferase